MYGCFTVGVKVVYSDINIPEDLLLTATLNCVLDLLRLEEGLRNKTKKHWVGTGSHHI